LQLGQIDFAARGLSEISATKSGHAQRGNPDYPAHLRFILALFEKIDGLIDRNSIDPGIKTRAALEGF